MLLLPPEHETYIDLGREGGSCNILSKFLLSDNCCEILCPICACMGGLGRRYCSKRNMSGLLGGWLTAQDHVIELNVSTESPPPFMCSASYICSALGEAVAGMFGVCSSRANILSFLESHSECTKFLGDLEGYF